MITMMRRYRKSLQVGLLVVIAAFVASLFIFGSSGFDGGGAPNGVATVNGETIPVERYQRRYQAYLDAYSQLYRERFSSALAEQLGLPQQVLNDLVQEAVVVQRARVEGLEVSDEELNAQIHRVPGFQEGGQFSLRRYQEFLRRRGMSAAAFEEEVRRELTRAKVEATVRAGVKVSEAELEQAFALRRAEVRAAWALVETKPLVDAATVTDEEIQAYLAAHQAEFHRPERRRVQYVTIAARDFVKPVPDAAVDAYYAEHAKEFEEPPRVRASHVLVRVPEVGGSEAEDRARAKVADVIRRAKAGEDFGKLARELSEDPGSAPTGGDLGLVARGEMVPQFEQALFALKKGEVSPEPVRTPFGFHAIKVVEVREGGRKPLREVAGQIRERLANEAAEKAARARAEEVRSLLVAAKDFMAEGKKLGLAPIDTTLARTDRTGLPGGPDATEEAAFALALGGVSPVVASPTGLVVLKAIEAIPAGVPPLAEIRENVALAARRAKAEAAALEKARQVAAAAASGDLPAAGRKLGATVGETARFSRAKPADKLPGDVMLAALGTAAGAVSEPVKTPQGYYVVRVLERFPADMSAFAGERDTFEREVLAQKQGLAWQAWVASARAGAKIEVSSRFQPSRS